MAEKQNDLLSLKIFNPDATLSQLNLAGISADNTQLKSEQDYAKMESVQSQPQFLDQSGKFDQNKFHQFYQDAQKDYNLLASTANNQTVYSKYNIFAPTNQRNWNPEFEIKRFNNPFEQAKGFAGIGSISDPKKSIEEIAQTRPVYDPATNTWQESPNDDFLGNFKDTRFLAQYEEDTDEKDPITGEIVHHVAGEFKLDSEGKPYYENANGRSIDGKTVLHLSDVFTTDGSAVNSIDFFDSDDMHKSAMGTLAKNVALVGSMFLPTVGPYVAGVVILQNAMQLGSVLGKMLVGSDSPTLNKIEGFSHFTNLQESKSQYSKDPNHMWSTENLLSLIGDVVGQLQTQRVIFKYAPALFKGKYGAIEEGEELLKTKRFAELSKYNQAKLGSLNPLSSKYGVVKSQLDMDNSLKVTAEVEKYMKDYYNMGGVISKAYMTGITVQDMFQEAKNSGANDEVATGLTIGYAAAEYALLSTGLGEWILPELRLMKHENKHILKTALSPVRETFKDGIETLNKAANEAVSREERHTLFKQAVNFGRKIANADYSLLKKSAGSILAGALGEGTEEVSEELLADAVRGIHDSVSWLKGDDKEMFNTDRIFDRYLQNFIGGFVGGGIAGLGFDGSPSAYKQFKDLENMTSQQAMQRIIYKLRNEKNAGKELRDTIRKMDWGDKNLAAFKFVEDENKNVMFAEAENYEESQDYAIKQAAYRQLNLVESVLSTIENEGGASASDKSILDANTLKDLRLSMFQNSAAAGQLLEQFNTEVLNMVKAQSNISSMTSIAGREENNVPDQSGEKDSQSMYNQTLQKEKEKFETAKQNAIDILTGKHATKFMTRAILELNPAIAKSFMIATFDQFVKQNLNKSVSELTDEERSVQYDKYVEYCKTAKKDSLEFAEQQYLSMVDLVRQNFIPSLETAYKDFGKINDLDTVLTEFYDYLKEIRLETLNPIEQLRKSPEEYISYAQATSPGFIQETQEGTVAKFRIRGLDALAEALRAQGDQVAIDYLQVRDNLDPNDEDFHNKAIASILPFAVHALNVVGEQYKNQGWINPVTKKYIFNLANLISDEFGKLSEAFLTDSVYELPEAAENPNLIGKEIIAPYKERAKLLLKGVDGIEEALDNFDPDDFGDMSPNQKYRELIESTLTEFDNRIQSIKSNIKELANGPTLELLDKFITDLSGTEHIPLSTTLDSVDAILDSKTILSDFSRMDLTTEASLKQALIATELMQAYLEGARTTRAGYTESANMLAGTALGDVTENMSTEKLNLNTTGINKMLNDIHKQVKENRKNKKNKLSDNQKEEEEEWEDLPLLDGVIADSILQDLTLINRKIHFILDLLEINKGQKLNEQIRINVNTAYLRYKAIMRLNDVAPDDWDKSELNKVNTLKLEQYLTKKDPLSLSDDEQYELDKTVIELEDAVYKFFEDNIRDGKKVSDILAQNKLNFYTNSEGLLNETTENWDDVTLWWYISQLRAVKSSEVYKVQAKYIGQDRIVPLDTQFLLAKLHIANVAHGDVMSEMQQALHDYIVEDLTGSNYDKRVEKLKKVLGSEKYARAFAEDEILSHVIENLGIIPKFSNITFGEGLPGAGKTTGSSKSFVQILSDGDSTRKALQKAVVISVSPKRAKDLGEFLNLEGYSTHDRKSFLESISNWKAPAEKNGVTEFKKGIDYKVGENNKLVHGYTIKADADVPSIIIIDEVSRFSDFELQLINEFARMHKISVITYGDFDQTQTIGSVEIVIPGISQTLKDKYGDIIKNNNTIVFNARLDRNNLMHGPKLGSTLRTANVQKTKNTTVMQQIVQEPSGIISLCYYQGVVPGKPGQIIAGDKVYTVPTKVKNDIPQSHIYSDEVLNKILADIDLMISSLTEGETIGYIFSDENSKLHRAIFEADGKTLKNKYKDKITPYYGTTAQSSEGQYFIIETDVTKKSNKQAFVQDLYTGITRSQVGSIVIVPQDGISGLKFTAGIKESAYSEEGITEESKVRYNDRKKRIIKRLFGDQDGSIQLIERTNGEISPTPTVAPVPAEPVTSSEETTPPTEPVVPTTPSINLSEISLETGSLQNYGHSFDGANQRFTFGDYTNKSVLPVVSQDWLKALGTQLGYDGTIPIEKFKYLTEITVSDTGKITLSLITDAEDSINIDLPPGMTDLKTLSKGELELLTPPEENPEPSEEPSEDPDEGETDPDTPNTDINPNPKELVEESKKTRKRSIRLASVDEGEKPSRKAKQEIAKSFTLPQLLFSFNSFENFGFEFDNDGNIIPKEGLDAEIAQHRIDGINGLLRLAQKYNDLMFDGKNAARAIQIISDIACAAMHRTSLNEISQQIEQSLFGGNKSHVIKCHFALKSSPILSQGKDYFNTQGKYAQYEKSSRERSMFNDSYNEESDDVTRKQIVLGIEIDGSPALEVPVVMLNSVLSLIQMKQEGNPVFGELLTAWNPEDKSISIHEGLNRILQKFDTKEYPQYRTIMNLIRLFNFSYPGYFIINKEFETNGKKYDLKNWTIGKDLLNLGSEIDIERGINSINGQNVYEGDWVPVDQTALDPRKTVSPILMTSQTVKNNKGEVIAKSGHSFVLISDDKSIPESKLWDEYRDDQNRDINERTNKVAIYYVMPPVRSFGQYMISLRNFCSVIDTSNTPPIGNNLTIFNVLNGIRKVLGSQFETLFGEGTVNKNVYNNTVSMLDELEALYKEAEETDDYSKVTALIKATEPAKWPRMREQTNERQLISVLKELVWPLSVTEKGTKDVNSYGNFNERIYSILEEAFQKSGFIIHEGSRIQPGSNATIKPVVVLDDNEGKYRSISKPTVYLGEDTSGYSKGDAVPEENSDNNWYISAKIQTSSYQTIENDESLGAFLNYMIRNCINNNGYQKKHADWKYYEGARADKTPTLIEETNEKQTAIENLKEAIRKALDKHNIPSDDLEEIVIDENKPLEGQIKQFVDYLNNKFMSYNVPNALIYINVDKQLGLVWKKVTNQGLASEPENIKVDNNGNISGILHMKDGSSYEFMYDAVLDKTQYAKLQKAPKELQSESETVVTQDENPQSETEQKVGYVIGKNKETVADEVEAAKILMFRKNPNINPEGLDEKIRQFLISRDKLGFWIKNMKEKYRNILLSNKFTDKQMANIENMMNEIFRYADELAAQKDENNTNQDQNNTKQDENNDSCNITTVK